MYSTQNGHSQCPCKPYMVACLRQSDWECSGGEHSSGPAVIPSVSEGGTMVGERSIWGKRSLRPLLLVTGGG